jgi:hypothetical protein
VSLESKPNRGLGRSAKACALNFRSKVRVLCSPYLTHMDDEILDNTIRELARIIYHDQWCLNIFRERWADPEYKFSNLEIELIELIMEMEAEK